MRRIHALELEDQPWLPARIRDYATDFLQFVIEMGDSYAPVVPLVRDALEACGTDAIVDLGSGAGGPWLSLSRRINAERAPVGIRLTDKYPNNEAAQRVQVASQRGLSYYGHPVDATRVPEELSGFRTIFTALHHFRPEQVQQILRDAVRNRQGIGAFECSERSARGILAMAISPLLVLLATPLIRPFRWSRLFWTYIVPVVPLLVLFDGTVSALRTYTPAELRDLAGSIDASDYEWRVGTVRGRAPIPVSYLIGYPKAATPGDQLGEGRKLYDEVGKKETLGLTAAGDPVQ